jgi:GNAT superfamily N-acetyltransferase
MIAFRTMQTDDVGAGLSLCRLAGWNQLERDWKLFLRLSPGGCRVGVDDNGNVIGTVTTLPYQDRFTWIGMVLVDPSRRHEGIGTQLLREAIHLAGAHETLKLDATPAGREVYRKLNFVDEYDITRMKLAMPVSHATVYATRCMQVNDIPSVSELDREVFGADRKPILESNFSAAPYHACVLEKQGRLMGYCLGRPGFDFNHIGPVVAQDVDTARQLLLQALRYQSSKPVIMDVTNHSADWVSFVSSIGFVALRPLIRMYRGANQHHGIPEKQFAILGPEYG